MFMQHAKEVADIDAPDGDDESSWDEVDKYFIEIYILWFSHISNIYTDELNGLTGLMSQLHSGEPYAAPLAPHI